MGSTIRSVTDIPGWFPWVDRILFEHLLAERSIVARGDLVELGVYLGKSAALMGRFVEPGESFTVCDLFGTPGNDDSNNAENARSYRNLERASFERNYLALHADLPTIVHDASSTIVDHVAEHSVRLMHVDASHLYEHVAIDVDSARRLLLPDGVVVFDDFRSDHTPGVSAAVWEAVFDKGLRPFCLTFQKLYGTFGDPAPYVEQVTGWLGTQAHRLWWETQFIAGSPVLRVSPRSAAPT